MATFEDKKNENPAPGQYKEKQTIGEGPKYSMGGKHEKQPRTFAPSLHCFKTDNQSPQFSFGTKSDSYLQSTYLKPIKTRDPGPGTYESGSMMSQVPATKFSRAAKMSLARKTAGPAPDSYTPMPMKSGKGIAMGQSPKLKDRSLERAAMAPGPGSYTLNTHLSNSKAKSILGGKIKGD